MKKNKKILLSLLILTLVFALMACATDNEELGQEDEVVQEPVEDNEIIESEDNTEESVDDTEESVDVDTNEDPDDVMIDSSDYISKIKLITKGSDTEEIKILDNIKGNLSHEKLPVLESLEKNRTYLVFLKDENGSTVLTDDANGLILLENDNHLIFEKINKKIHN